MALTGIAATLLTKGMTVHKVLGLPVPLLSNSTSNIAVQSKEVQFFRQTDVFICDEVPMAPRYTLEIMDRTLKDIMSNDLLVGGKIVILGGDFRQLLPIIPRSIRSKVINLSIKSSILWNVFHKFQLTCNMRAIDEDISFSKFVLDVGNGDLNDSNDNTDIPERCVTTDSNFINSMYGHLIRNHLCDYMSSSVILDARNIDVNGINKTVVSLLDSYNERVYTSVDLADHCDDNGLMGEGILPEYLNSLDPQNLPPHELHLRVNSIIMFIRNISIYEGLCNGTRLRILDLNNNLLKCKILAGDKEGEVVFF